MIESFVTQCPHCRTSFRVNPAQLAAAHGAVRCGACLHVFNAARQLLAQGHSLPAAAQPIPPPAPSSEPSAAHASEPPISQTHHVPDKHAEDTLWIHDDLDLDSLDLDEELAKLEEQEQQLSQQFLDLDRAAKQTEAFPAPADAEQQEPDEQWAEALLHDDPPTPAPSNSPTPSPPAAEFSPHQETPAPLSPNAPLATSKRSRQEPVLNLSDTHTDDHEPAEHELHLSAERDAFIGEPDSELDTPAAMHTVAEADPAQEQPPGKAERHEPGLRDEHLFELDDEPLQLDWQRPRKSWGRRLGWGLLNLLAAIALSGQYLNYHFDELARQDQYRPWFEQLCPTLGCLLPSKVDIEQIKSSNLVVRSHPEFSGALVVDAILYNRAPFTQPFPLLEMRFADINGQLLASRRFKPSEYLAGELAGQAEMPPQTPIHISLDILDPGTHAVNYSLSFHSPE
ncbi:putative Zn finger-like uncharacterized protein [Pseudomonas sp. SJZ079]|uniref:DUF3426 domain-containing protein n=1 Tax=Pseudomonas sp. SJZ079 TaxID=2572887 RepID=UPI00119C1C76|nr:DUF3426 domain-containing protein [Pseudomonas sp. SJZ079]TWC41275.1 putative Zn finger-like uncharacterized protein [Pseudomonas sp. SJZ079]